jgi:predicted RecB family nuclease
MKRPPPTARQAEIKAFIDQFVEELFALADNAMSPLLREWIQSAFGYLDAGPVVKTRSPKPQRLSIVSPKIDVVEPTPATARDIYNWAEYSCETLIKFSATREVVPAAPTMLQRLLFDDGTRIESAYIDELKARFGDDVYECTREPLTGDAIERRWQETLHAMRSGKKFIVHPFMQAYAGQPEHAWGEPDVLVRNDALALRSLVGPWAYEVADVKSSAQPKEYQRLQVAFYSLLLAETQGVEPAEGALVLPRERGTVNPPAFIEHRMFLKNYLPLIRKFLKQRVEVITALSPDYHFTSKCKSCGFRSTCLARAERDRDLNLLPGMRHTTRATLRRAGVAAFTELAVLDEDQVQRLAARANGSPQIISGAWKHATALVSGKAIVRDAAPRVLSVLNDEPTLYLDLESDLLGDGVYLFGLLLDDPGAPRDANGTRTWQLIAEHPRHEGATFHATLDLIESLRATRPSLVLAHYGDFERFTMQQLARRYPEHDAAARVERLFASALDVHRMIFCSMYLPVGSYSLKEVAPKLRELTGGEHGAIWRSPATRDQLACLLGDVNIEDAWRELATVATLKCVAVGELLGATADLSCFWYRMWRDRRHPIWLQLIKIYNEDDLLATKATKAWLLACRAMPRLVVS